MSLKAVEQIFTGATAPLAINDGTVSVSTTTVTGSGTFFTSANIGMKIGFGNDHLAGITTWYVISAVASATSLTINTSAGNLSAGTSYVITGYDPAKTSIGSLMIQKSGTGPEDNYIGPLPVSLCRPMEEPVATPLTMWFPHVITYNATIDWVFIIENSTVAAKRIYLYEYDKSKPAYNWKGFITITTPAATNVLRGFRALRYQHTTGTVAVGAPVSVLATGTVTVTAAGVVTHSATSFLQSHVGMMIGFGSSTIASIDAWSPIMSFTSTSVLNIPGSSAAYAAGTSFVIASCTVTGTNTLFKTEAVASGTTYTGSAGGLGPRIGFGSTDPLQITQWYQIGYITSDTALNLVSSPGVVASGTPYVIEELRFVLTFTNTTVLNGGLFLVKGVGYLDFNTAGGVTLPAMTSVVIDDQRGVYWLADMANVNNVNPCGCAIQPEVNKGLHYAYVLDGVANTFMKVFRYNLRATGTPAAGKITLSSAYTTTASTTFTVTVSSGVVTCSGAGFASTMVGMKIGFGSSSPALISAWYVIGSYASTSSVTLTDLTVNVSGGTAFIVDSADVIVTGNVGVTGTTLGVNNGRIGTLQHGPGAGVESLYFLTASRIYRAALSKIYNGSLDWISDNRPEVPPGSTNTFLVTGALNLVEIIDSIDRLLVLTTGAGAIKSYITRYPAVAGEQFDQFFGVDDKQFDQSIADPAIPIHYNTNSQVCSAWSQRGITHIIKHGANATVCQMYALPFGAHTAFASATDQRVITPALSAPNCSSFVRLLLTSVTNLGGADEYRTPTGAILSYYRTNGISDNSGSWTLLPASGDLTSVGAASAIQFMFEFVTISHFCLPGRLISAAVLYNDFSTDSHFQPSAGKSVVASKQFAWRFSAAFGTTVPTLRVRLFDAVSGALLVDDNSASPVGTWEKTADATTWVPYGTLADKANELTYIRYTPATLPDNIKIRALLTQY